MRMTSCSRTQNDLSFVIQEQQTLCQVASSHHTSRFYSVNVPLTPPYFNYGTTKQFSSRYRIYIYYHTVVLPFCAVKHE